VPRFFYRSVRISAGKLTVAGCGSVWRSHMAEGMHAVFSDA
jgi:hypothetical protein